MQARVNETVVSDGLDSSSAQYSKIRTVMRENQTLKSWLILECRRCSVLTTGVESLLR